MKLGTFPFVHGHLNNLFHEVPVQVIGSFFHWLSILFFIYSGYMYYEYLLLFSHLPFHSVNGAFDKHKVLIVQFINFLFIISIPCVLRNICILHCHKGVLLCFL